MDTTLAKIGVKVADEVWIAAALLHREHPEKPDFTVEEIVDRAKQEGLFKPFRRGVYVHVIHECFTRQHPDVGVSSALATPTIRNAKGAKRPLRGKSYRLAITAC